MKKVSESLRELVGRGLLGAEEAGRVALLAALRPTLACEGSAIPAKVLAKSAEAFPSSLQIQIESLGSLGFAVERVGECGYRLAYPFDDMLVPEAVLTLLLDSQGYPPTLPLGLPYRYQARCESTNLMLRQEAAEAPTGLLVVTDDQTQGRGRLGRSWSSRPGEDLTFSVLLRPHGSPEEASLLSLAAALAVTEVLEAVLPELRGRVRVKWPNDVLIDDRKVCGILLESSLLGSRLEWVVAGLGLNVNSDPSTLPSRLAPADMEGLRGRHGATSLLAESGRRVPRGSLLARLLAQLSLRWSASARSETLARLRARDALRGRRVWVSAGPTDGALVAAGEAAGIGSKGELLLKGDDGGITRVFSGEVTLSVDSPAE